MKDKQMTRSNLVYLLKSNMLILVFILVSCEGKYSKKNDGEREILSKQTGIPISFIKMLEWETHAKAKHLDRNESTDEEKQVLLPGVFVGVKSKMDYYNLVKRIGARINISITLFGQNHEPAET